MLFTSNHIFEIMADTDPLVMSSMLLEYRARAKMFYCKAESNVSCIPHNAMTVVCSYCLQLL